MHHFLAIIAALVLLTIGIVRPAIADPVTLGQVEQILPPDVTQSDQFGRRIALDHALLAVGSPQDADAGISAGSVYVFQLDTEQRWQQVIKLYADDSTAFDEFGRDVDLEGDVLIAGAPEGLFADTTGTIEPDETNTGSAYIFRRNSGGTNNWGQVAKLVASDGQTGDDFGRAVAVSGLTAVAGARLTDEAGFFSGSAYVFQNSAAEAEQWPQIQKLTASDSAGRAFFGEDVAIDGGVIAIGAPDDLFAAATAGKVYVFTESVLGWNETAILTGSTAVAGDRLGTSVTVSGNTIAAGAYGSDNDQVFVFERVPETFEWVEAAVLSPPCGGIDTNFGQSVALKGDLLIVGAPFDDEAADNAGAVYVYERHTGGPNQWGFIAKVIATDGGSLDQFGVTVSVSDDALVTGAPGSDVAGPDGGSAYSARLNALDSDIDGVPDLLDNCQQVPNGPDTTDFAGPSQRDTDADGFGNMCDADLNNDCIINFVDLAMMQNAFFGADEHADLNGDGQVNFSDLNLITGRFFATPGPSASQTCNVWSQPPPQQDGAVQIITTLSCETP